MYFNHLCSQILKLIVSFVSIVEICLFFFTIIVFTAIPTIVIRSFFYLWLTSLTAGLSFFNSPCCLSLTNWFKIVVFHFRIFHHENSLVFKVLFGHVFNLFFIIFQSCGFYVYVKGHRRAFCTGGGRFLILPPLCLSLYSFYRFNLRR